MMVTRRRRNRYERSIALDTRAAILIDELRQQTKNLRKTNELVAAIAHEEREVHSHGG